MSSGSKYTRPTGPGYSGVYRVGDSTTEITCSCNQAMAWDEDSDVVAVDDQSEPGIQLVERHATTLTPIEIVPVSDRRSGLVASIRSTILQFLNVGVGDDVRVYDRDVGVTLVPAHQDPFVGGEA